MQKFAMIPLEFRVPFNAIACIVFQGTLEDKTGLIYYFLPRKGKRNWSERFSDGVSIKANL